MTTRQLNESPTPSDLARFAVAAVTDAEVADRAKHTLTLAVADLRRAADAVRLAFFSLGDANADEVAVIYARRCEDDAETLQEIAHLLLDRAIHLDRTAS